MIQDVRTQAMNLPGGRQPALSRKALIPAVVVAGLAAIVLVRASAMPPTTPMQAEQTRAAHAVVSAGVACEQNVWPYVTSGCLQGAASSENVRIVVGRPPPDPQTQIREAEALISAAARPQKGKRAHAHREHDGELIRERRARRNATFF